MNTCKNHWWVFSGQCDRVSDNFKSNRDIRLKQEAFYSVISNLNFDIYHVPLNTVLIEITAFKYELTFFEDVEN